MKNNLYCSETTPLIHSDLEEAEEIFIYTFHMCQ